MVVTRYVDVGPGDRVDPRRHAGVGRMQRIQALLLHFREHGKKAIEKVARNQPAAYLKILALLVPREMKVATKYEWASVAPFGNPDQRTDFTPGRIAVQKADGTVVSERLDPAAHAEGKAVDNPFLRTNRQA